MNTSKVVIIGLDCASPKLIFHTWKQELPTLSRLMENGSWGHLRSCTPPITVPAWMCMMTGKNPGQLGIYGFRERKGRAYTKSTLVDSSYVHVPTVWDTLGRYGLQSIVIGVPPTYPPKPIQGTLVSDFLTPDTRSRYTYPWTLKHEIRDVVGKYRFDSSFRIDKKNQVISEIYDMTDKRFRLALHLLTTKPWDFFILVEIGTDRIHHAFWKFMDQENKNYTPQSPYADVIRTYYRYIDTKIGQFISHLPPETVVYILSDHGVKNMAGAFCINEWLIREGYLVLHSYPKTVMPLENARVNWTRTRAWAWGGYYARIFLNTVGRDPAGMLSVTALSHERSVLMEKLRSITDTEGKPMTNIVETPQTLYGTVNGNPPDILAIFNNLSSRSAGTIGHNTQWIFDNDTGPDDAVHDWNGIFIQHAPHQKFVGRIPDVNILDIRSIILQQYHISNSMSLMYH